MDDEIYGLHCDIGRLETENTKLRKLCERIWNCARLMDANKHIEGMRITDQFRAECEASFIELGIKVATNEQEEESSKEEEYAQSALAN